MDLPSFKVGHPVLQDYLKKNPIAFSRLEWKEFQTWLENQIGNRKQDPVFSYRCQIRDLQKQYWAILFPLQEKLARLEGVWKTSPNYHNLEKIKHTKIGHEKAIEGLQQSIVEMDKSDKKENDDKKLKCQKKLDDYQKKLQQLENEEQQLIQKCPEKEEWESCQKELLELKTKFGLFELEKALQATNLSVGHRTTETGYEFENLCRDIIQNFIIPDGIGTHCSTQILKQVKLGCSRAEFDYVVIHVENETMRNNIKTFAVEVLAIIEVKRNPNDIADSFRIRQENLAWFTGDQSGYDPSLYRTKEFRDGHFTCPAIHSEGNKNFLFTKDSFRNFRRSNYENYFLQRLFFITVERPLTGMATEDFNRLLFRISTDVHFEWSESYINDCFLWIKKFIHPTQTREILEIFAKEYHFANQIIFTKKGK